MNVHPPLRSLTPLRTPLQATFGTGRPARLLARVTTLLLAAWLPFAPAARAQAPADPAAAARALHARAAELAPQLEKNVFGQPMVLRSDEQGSSVAGDVYARIARPFADVRGALTTPVHWCDVLILHLNVKRCVPAAGGLQLNLGRKFDEPIEQTYAVKFEHRVVAAGADYLQVRMTAGDGPMGTRDYQIVFEAVPLDEGRVFVHFRYAYAFGTAARLAMKTYLATLGRGKVGFSLEPDEAGGPPVPVGGTRGAMERNAMRYYLAIVVYLDSLAAPPPERVERRLSAWFAATERYAKQLHELDRDEYLKMKRAEIARPG